MCPASLIGQWDTEIQTRCRRNKLSCVIHHGNSREKMARQLSKFDIVITTYQIVPREKESNGALFQIKWERLIIDEGHIIRNHKTKVSMAVCSLHAHYKWVLTGTPIQNKEMDVFALLKFLRCQPFDQLPAFKKWIDNKSAGGQQRLNALMKSLLLRRTKQQLIQAGLINDMPTKEVQLVEVHLEKPEQNVYHKILIFSKTLFGQFLHQRAERAADGFIMGDRVAKSHNTAYQKAHEVIKRIHGEVQSHQILVLLLRLRQICCHPGMINQMLEDNLSGMGDSLVDDSLSDVDLLDQINKLNLEEESGGNIDADAAYGDIDDRMSIASSRILNKNNPIFDYDRPTSKIKAILSILKHIVTNSRDKCVVVSQWASYLTILGNHIMRDGIKYVSLTGSIPIKHRGDIVNRFNTPDGARVLLLSLTAGGVGLNLIGGNHLIIVDPHWNPQLEAQAQDRVYRVGQKKPVTIYK